jgi:hypothetical protein
MVCFCKQSTASLSATLQALMEVDFSLSAQTAASLRVSAVANWLSARSLPAPPWQADPDWLELELPTPKLSLNAMATLSAMANVRAQAMAMFNIDLLAQGSATAMVRLVATLNARLAALPDVSLDLSVLLSLAAQLEAAESVSLAASLNLFTPDEALTEAYQAPGGIELSLWGPFLQAIASLSPLIALQLQLGITDSASLSLAIRAMLSINVPVLLNVSLAMQLIAAFSAMARIQAVLGVDVQATAMAEIEAMVALRVDAAFALIPPNASPPRISTCPTMLAPAAVVSAAASAEISLLAELDWNVSALASLSVMASLMPALSLSAALQTSVNLSPCAFGCDAGAIMAAL